MSLQSPYTIYLNFDGSPISGTDLNSIYKQNTIFPVGLATRSGSAEKTDIIEYIKRKTEIFNVEITTSRSTYDAAYKKMMIVFSENGKLDGPNAPQPPISYIYDAMSKQMGSPYAMRSSSFPTLGIAFVWSLGSATGYGLDEYAVKCIGKLFGLSADGCSSGYGSKYFGNGQEGVQSWSPIMTHDSNLKPLQQWSKGEYTCANNQEDDISKIGTKAGFLKNKPQNINNSSNMFGGSSVKAIKHRMVTRQDFKNVSSLPVYTGPVLEGIIGYPYDVDYLKILLDAGEYTIRSVYVKNSMLDVKLSLMDPTSELNKERNKISSNEMNECKNKISTYPSGAKFECFACDLNASGLAVSSPSNTTEVAGLKFTLNKKSFVHIAVEGAASDGSLDSDPAKDQAAGKNGYSKYGSVGKYYIAGIDKSKVSNDLSLYPPCYLNYYSSGNAAIPAGSDRILPDMSMTTKDGDFVAKTGFYIQESGDDDTINGGKTNVYKLFTSFNGSLLETKFITDFREYMVGYEVDPEKHSYFHAPSRNENSKGKSSMIEFYMDQIERTNPAPTESAVDSNYVPQQPPNPTPSSSASPTPTPTQTPTPTPACLCSQVTPPADTNNRYVSAGQPCPTDYEKIYNPSPYQKCSNGEEVTCDLCRWIYANTPSPTPSPSPTPTPTPSPTPTCACSDVTPPESSLNIWVDSMVGCPDTHVRIQGATQLPCNSVTDGVATCILCRNKYAPTMTPSSSPTASPTASPTPSPTATPFPCDCSKMGVGSTYTDGSTPCPAGFTAKTPGTQFSCGPGMNTKIMCYQCVPSRL